ncbi:MAG: 30S ribosomal protein S5 [Candidatus Woesearchaeota archaeon]
MPSEEELGKKAKPAFDILAWQPRTSIGKMVKEGKITSIDHLLDNGLRILEPGIVDALLPGLEVELLMIGQSKGKFGGGQRRIFKQTQHKTPEGNRPAFSTIAVVGNYNGYVGCGFGKAKDTLPAREKAIRNAKLSIFKIMRVCGSWECGCGTPHSIPFMVEGKCGSIRMKLLPAPKGTGLCVQKECAKMIKLAGIKDIHSVVFGQTRSAINLVFACVEALKALTKSKIRAHERERLSIAEAAV